MRVDVFVRTDSAAAFDEELGLRSRVWVQVQVQVQVWVLGRRRRPQSTSPRWRWLLLTSFCGRASFSLMWAMIVCELGDVFLRIPQAAGWLARTGSDRLVMTGLSFEHTRT